MNTTSYMWLVAYGTGRSALRSRTLRRVFDLAAEFCDLAVEPVRVATLHRRAVERVRFSQWLDRALEKGHDDDIISLWSESWRWVFFSECSTSHARWTDGDGPDRLDPRLVFGIELDLIRAHAAPAFCRSLCDVLVHDPDIWYGYIDITDIESVGDFHFYLDNGTTGTWDRLIELRWWQDHGLVHRNMVRGVFWANVLGSEFYQRLQGSGFEERCEREQVTPLIIEANNRAAILLDDDPRAFAGQRAHLHASADCVRLGGVLRASFSAAGLL